MIPLRPYQSQLDAAIRAAWTTGARNVMAVLPTGGGKTVIFSNVLATFHEPSVAIAHRQELVGQMSLALARCGVTHRIVAPNNVIKRIVASHVKETGSSYYNPRAHCAVAGIDTLTAREKELSGWLQSVRLWIVDEGHHVLEKNKWGSGVALMPNAIGLLVTATPKRADRKGLGRWADGVADTMVVGPSMRDLINDGWLTDYRIFCPQSDIDLSEVTTGADGDYNKKKLKAAVRRSHIVGDVVTNYQRIAPGKLGVVFASDVETAADISIQFNKAGIPAEVVHAKTPDNVRAEIMARFRRGDLTILVNVDLFGEGFDLPAIEVVIMARPTESFALYAQQFGRALRLMLDGPTPETREGRLAAIAASRKPRAIIIDHVGNVVRFQGPPDAAHNQQWSLDAGEKRSREKPDDAIPLRACLNVSCMQVYERFYPACPYCGHKPIPASRSAPEFVDGDLTELDPETLKAMRGEVERIDEHPDAFRRRVAHAGAPLIGQHAAVKRHIERQEAQQALRASMAWWAGHHTALGRTDAESYRRFYHTFKIDALSAQALGAEEAFNLAERINGEIVKMMG